MAGNAEGIASSSSYDLTCRPRSRKDRLAQCWVGGKDSCQIGKSRIRLDRQCYRGKQISSVTPNGDSATNLTGDRVEG